MDEQEGQLAKQERRELAKEQRAEERQASQRSGMLTKLVIALLVIGLFAGGGWWVWKEVTKPLPAVLGEAMEDMGREHVPDGTVVEYNSNPPTSGSHYAEWTRAGVYDKPVSDGHLVHSLEHGYVIISYNCQSIRAGERESGRNLYSSTLSLFYSKAYAHEEELTPQASPPGEATESADLGEAWQSQECKDLVAKLTAVYEKKGKRKLIVIPRPSLDTKIALTAWGRIYKSNEFKEQEIVDFIELFRDKGPEKTVE